MASLSRKLGTELVILVTTFALAGQQRQHHLCDPPWACVRCVGWDSRGVSFTITCRVVVLGALREYTLWFLGEEVRVDRKEWGLRLPSQ